MAYVGAVAIRKFASCDVHAEPILVITCNVCAMCMLYYFWLLKCDHNVAIIKEMMIEISFLLL